MRNIQKIGAFIGIFLAMVAAGSNSSEAQAPSPKARSTCKFADGKTITANYSSPHMRGRKIFGDLVPYGEVWRAGADDATAFVPNVDIIVDGKDVPAGKYTLFVLPTQTKWTLIISRQTGEWGIPYPGEKFDFGRMEMKVS